jgi:hypothetical protein
LGERPVKRFLTEASVDALVSFMKDFEKANGEAHPTG